jgi:crotonobetainyl-CoA:carnitine CoA-transferase CaiB-like acyl-CoA transferase
VINARVLELGQVIAGNYAGALLADLGAEVIKIEPLTGDPARNSGIAGLGDESAIHLTFNRGKKSIALDLKHPSGKRVFRDLVTHADVVLDNVRPGVMARLGLDYAALRQLNPRLICCSVTGFGQTGPAKERPAFDLVIQALSGHMAITGEPGGPPARVGVPLADLMGGVFGCLGVCAALCARESTGAGQMVDVSMLDALVSLLTYDATLYLNKGKEAMPMGSSHAYLVPWEAFQTRDGFIAVAVREEKFWRLLCDALERPELKSDPRMADNRSRVENRQLVRELLAERFLSEDTATWFATLEGFDIPCAPVNTLAGVFADPQVQARELVDNYTHRTLGEVSFVRSPIVFDQREKAAEPPPGLGEHTREVLQERLGYSDEDLASLMEERAIGGQAAPELRNA